MRLVYYICADQATLRIFALSERLMLLWYFRIKAISHQSVSINHLFNLILHHAIFQSIFASKRHNCWGFSLYVCAYSLNKYFSKVWNLFITRCFGDLASFTAAFCLLILCLADISTLLWLGLYWILFGFVHCLIQPGSSFPCLWFTHSSTIIFCDYSLIISIESFQLVLVY